MAITHRLAMAVLHLVVAASGGAALDFYVGGSDGWTANPAEPYNTWAERNRFQINDTLVFRHKEDSVLQVSQSHYNDCNATDPLLRIDGGDVKFVLKNSGAYFFIGGDAARCNNNGERLIVVVLAAHSTPAPPPVPSPAPCSPPHPPAPATTPAGNASSGNNGAASTPPSSSASSILRDGALMFLVTGGAIVMI